MEKQIFNKGERVYVQGYGWGTVSIDRRTQFVLIDFDDFKDFCGIDVNRNFISYTKYFLQNFSQEKPEGINELIGKWGKFQDLSANNFIIDRLKSITPEKTKRFFGEKTYFYMNFEPLTEEQIKILGLE